MQTSHESGFSYARAALENEHAAKILFGNQVIKAGNKALGPHSARELRSDMARKHPSYIRRYAMLTDYENKMLFIRRERKNADASASALDIRLTYCEAA